MESKSRTRETIADFVIPKNSSSVESAQQVNNKLIYVRAFNAASTYKSVKSLRSWAEKVVASIPENSGVDTNNMFRGMYNAIRLGTSSIDFEDIRELEEHIKNTLL